MKTYEVHEIAKIVGGRVEGNIRPNTLIKGVRSLSESQPHHLSFIAENRYVSEALQCKVGVLLVEETLALNASFACPIIRVPDAREALRLFLLDFQEGEAQPKSGTESPCYLGKNCQLGKNLYRGAFSYIGDNVQIGDNVCIHPQVWVGDNVQIGDDCIIYAGARIYANTQIGNCCIIHAGAVLGADGFGYTKNGKLIPHVGQVVLEDDVHVGANTTIDRAVFSKTLISKSVKIDNQVAIGHNVQIGEGSMLSGQVGIAGSAKLGKYCLCSGQSGISSHVDIADHTHILGRAGVLSSIHKPHQTYIGLPASDRRTFIKNLVAHKSIDRLEKRLEKLEKQPGI